MDSVIVNALPDGANAPGAVATARTSNSTAGSPLAGLFASALTSRMLATHASVKVPAGAPAAAPSTAQLALEAKIAKMIDAGAAPADVIASLAGNLADGIAQGVDAPGSDARATLQTLFASALAPPGESSDLSLAQRVRQLAQRYMKLEKLATTITGQASGQQNRIAGKLLDARRAKDIPAPTTTDPTSTIAAGALLPMLPGATAPHDGASPVGASRDASAVPPTTTAPSTTSAAVSYLSGVSAGSLVMPAAKPAGGDGRIVKTETLAAIASGGDTLLGRILARAANVADARSAAVINAPTTAVAAAPANPIAPTANGTPDTALVAFVKSFEAALKSASPADSGQAGLPDAPGGSAAPPAPPAPPAPDSSTAVAPFIVSTAPTISHAADGAAGAPAPVATPIDHTAIADQVLRGAFMRNVGQSSEMRLSLVPETLGDVNVKLVVTGGNVTAHIVAETPEVRDALVAAQPQLTKSLADAGLKLQSFNVDISGNGFAGFAQQQGDPSRNGDRAQRPSGTAEIDEPIDDIALEAVPSFGPPTPAGARAGDLNHLA